MRKLTRWGDRPPLRTGCHYVRTDPIRKITICNRDLVQIVNYQEPIIPTSEPRPYDICQVRWLQDYRIFHTLSHGSDLLKSREQRGLVRCTDPVDPIVVTSMTIDVFDSYLCFTHASHSIDSNTVVILRFIRDQFLA